ncbi:hypothetical protein BZA70DRAFT_277158 [Myxozyma melibiosi]|uniref:t-SNARE coiled-coil homology domain-containing protein n=1 Tax=Myxozyma melibiosi TaxID=54550 RepID=A0ABR1F7L5_9ASCO
MTLVKKLLGKAHLGHARSRSDGDYDLDAADSLSDDDLPASTDASPGPAYNPYAIGSNPYNSVASAYSRTARPVPTPPALTPTTSASPPPSPYYSTSPAPYTRISPVSPSSASIPLSPPRVPGLNGTPRLNSTSSSSGRSRSSSNSKRNPYEPVSVSQKRFSDPIVYNPALSDQQGTSPYESLEPSESLEVQRQKLLQKKKQSTANLPQFRPASPDYDPSIMETEAEREQRYAMQRQGTAQQSHHQTVIPEDRELSTEQAYAQEYKDGDELEIQAMKDHIKFLNKQSIDSADSALRYAEEAEASGMKTLQMLGQQSDQIGNAESSIAIAANKTKLAEDYASELKALNRNMLAIHVSNPFNSRKKIAEKDLQLRNDFQQRQKTREETRRLQYESQQNIARAMGNAPGERRRQLTETELKYRQQMLDNKAKLAEKSRYMFEPDDDDFEDERNVNERLDHIANASARLNSMAKAISSEVEDQNNRIAKLSKKTEDTEVGVYLNTTRLARYG